MPDTSEEFLQTKVEFWVAIMFCFFWIFIEFYQVPDYSGKCQTKGFRLVWQMPDSSEHFFWHAHMCQTQLKNLGGNKSMFYVILNQFYKCQTKLQNKNPCYLWLRYLFLCCGFHFCKFRWKEQETFWQNVKMKKSLNALLRHLVALNVYGVLLSEK